MRRLAFLVALVSLTAAQVAAASTPSAANPTRLAKKAAPKGPLGHSGRWITDRSGRVVILHGLNMVYKRPPYAPDATGFGADDAAFLRRYGFNTIRLGVIYKGVEPEPGRYDDGYLARIARTERILARRGVFSQLDFHQDLYNERFGGEGWPDWAVLDDGMPAEPLTGFPASYVSSPGLNRAFDNFWANAVGPGAVGLVDRFAAAWRHVAARFKRRPSMMGYDLLNEPWPGSEWPSCANPEGCPVFDEGEFTAFYEKVIAAIRQTDRRSLIWYEPQVQFNFGSDSHVDGLADPRLGFSFHVYCLSAAAGGGNSPTCGTADNLVFDNADKQARQTGSALLLSEFGATDENDVNLRIVESADEHRVSWQYWHYCGCRDPTTQAGPGDTQAVVRDPRRPPRGKNLKHAKLRVLVRPYPQAVAGTPLRFDFDPQTKRFELLYTTRRATERRGRFMRGLTDVFVPKLHYRRGFRVRATGATYYLAGGQHLILRARPGARRVSVVVRPR